MVRTILLLLVYLLTPIGLMYLHSRFAACRTVGSIIMAYFVGIVLSLTDLSHSTVPETEAMMGLMKGGVQNICVPMAISLMLFASSFRQWVGHWRQIIVAFSIGVVAISTTVLLSFMAFKSFGIPELDKAAGLMMGFYTGGTPNVASLKMALNPSNETFLLVNSFEILITFFLLAFLVGGGYKLIRKVLPYRVEKQDQGIGSKVQRSASVENYRFMRDRRIWRNWWLPIGMALGIAAISAFVSLLFPPTFRIVAVILCITTLSIVASFWEKLRKAPRSFELGMYFILVFSVLIASEFSFSKIGPETRGLFFFILVILVGSVSIHFLLAKLCGIEADMFTISMVALIFSPPFVPSVAGAMKNRSCVPGGVLIGLLGYAVGNYVGVGMYGLCNLF